MELIQELFVDLLKSTYSETVIPEKFDFEHIIEKECYQALKKIKDILRDETLADAECFAKIEEIVCLFEDMGVDCGSRHDF